MPVKSILSITVYALTVAAFSSNFSAANAEAVAQQHDLPQSMLLDGNPVAPVAGLTDIKFNELFKMPVGAQGLEVTKKAQGLDGKKVRIVGYMVKAEPPVPGMFVLSTVPEEMGDEDEKLVDDFPPNVIFVHLSDSKMIIPNIEGLIKLTGTLQIGSFNEADEHVSTFRLAIDPSIERDLKQVLTSMHAEK